MTMAVAEADAAQQGRLPLGAVVRWQGGSYQVVALQGTEVQLCSLGDDGCDARALVSAVVGAEDFALLDEKETPLPGVRLPDTGALSVVEAQELERVRQWERHLLEIRNGVPPGMAEGTPPRPGYDPGRFTIKQRIAAKAAELKALGWSKASAGTVERRYQAYRARGVYGLLRAVRPGSAWGRTDERVVQLLLREEQASRKETACDATALYERLQAAVRRRYPDVAEKIMISPATFYRLLKRLDISPKRLKWPTHRRMDEANGATAPYEPTTARLLGEQVQIDSTGLDILAVGDDGRVVSVELTAAIDVATRSIIGAMIVPKSPGRGPRGRRLGGRATRSFDAVLMLAQALAPMPARPGWSPRALAEHSQLPYADLLACDPQMEGAAARPVIRPRKIVVDHGKIFNSEHFDDVCTMLGIDVAPARERTATDKAIIESTFGAIKKGFCQHAAGYTGEELAHRGKHVADGPLWTLNKLQDLLDQWIVVHWQQTPHEGLRNPFLPGMKISPNRMYATLVAAEGHVPLPLTPHQNRKLLPFKYLMVTDKGVRIDHRTYNSEELQEYRGKHSGIPGQGRKWQIRYSPYAPRWVWLYDHTCDDWVKAEFIHQRLISDAWTQYTYEQATLNVLEAGGDREDEREIAREVSRLRARARRGPVPQEQPRVPELFTGPALDLDLPEADPYEGVPDPVPGSIERAPSLLGDPRAIFDLAGSACDPGPAGAVDGAGTRSGTDQEEATPGLPPARTPHSPRARPGSLRGSAADIFRTFPAQGAGPSDPGANADHVDYGDDE
ncbi:Mu transposase C-terminal domain-containing protein [Streptomyces sp. DSM 42041]|uniref:Mu transposase C-terminal domain-containing protein n=1 Tax=Streptomyces hazeniae TaxID=3075538 RepID=A0ABU2P3E7_9ACTN|nr:Mu transposase C-terminal domain-containing protein [Streptomyces sp. DSM 42041]MDT0382428.1 Mu transposase C-terminal domain-containing protein [Streptomyces sp. DSM 42041]